ncbi:MAG: RraA family protein [SAR324 cluster bacterium]|nr:RraA family protein [SAR324 cluster bacterium]MDP6639367.1 RraA family protein [SAR324 cluster bacterium]MDP7137973.1 RraA family protein [SAR324 cluster bacterium]HJL86861.1 RraA family protein [SAR324 cluster bacterium]HJO46675.1 RraA family protein [SAR324 cluster bacterium]
MIKDPPLLKIRRFSRTFELESLASIQGVPLGFLVDAMDGRGALNHQIRLFDGLPEDSKLFGLALTCDCGPGDNLGLFGAVAEAQPGDVIVAATDAFEGTCLTGDLLMGMARNRKVAGLVTDGLVRDASGIKEVGLPVFCRGITPNSPVRNGPGSVGFPVVLGGVRVESGDIIAADSEGVVVIPKHQLPKVLSRIPEIQLAESKTEDAVAKGMELLDSVKELLESDQVVYFDENDLPKDN